MRTVYWLIEIYKRWVLLTLTEQYEVATFRYQSNTGLGARYRPEDLLATNVEDSATILVSFTVLVQVCQPFSPVAAHDTLYAGSSRQHRNQVWSVIPCMAQRSRTFVPGLPTPTGATGGRRPGRPYTVVHV